MEARVKIPARPPVVPVATRDAVNELEHLAELAVALSRNAGWASSTHLALDAALGPVIDEVVPVGAVLERAVWSRSS